LREKEKKYLRLVRQPIVVLGLRALLLAQFLADPSDLLRWFPQCKTLGVMAQVKLAPIEHRAHVARVARVETHPGDVRCGSEGLKGKTDRLSIDISRKARLSRLRLGGHVQVERNDHGYM